MAKKNNYSIGIAITITLASVFGFLWFSGIDDSPQTSLSAAPDVVVGR